MEEAVGFSGGGMYKRPAYQRKIWGCHILTPKLKLKGNLKSSPFWEEGRWGQMTWDDTICRTSKPYHFWDNAGGCGDSGRYHLQSFDGKFDFRAESTSHGRSTETWRWIRFQYTGQLFGLFGDFLWFNSIRHYWSLVPSKWVHHPAWCWNVLLTRPKMERDYGWFTHYIPHFFFNFQTRDFRIQKTPRIILAVPALEANILVDKNQRHGQQRGAAISACEKGFQWTWALHLMQRTGHWAVCLRDWSRCFFRMRYSICFMHLSTVSQYQHRGLLKFEYISVDLWSHLQHAPRLRSHRYTSTHFKA